jgi:hypothetical protein
MEKLNIQRKWRKNISLPVGYRKKIVNNDDDWPLSRTFTLKQIEKRIAFYQELNKKRNLLSKNSQPIEKKFALFGWNNSTTVRVYMRETVSKIAMELFSSDYVLSVCNINTMRDNGTIDKDRGYVLVTVKATKPEIKALLDYIKPGKTYYVYDGEEKKYIPGNTEKSEFIITKPEDPRQPKRYWRRSQSFIFDVREIDT